MTTINLREFFYWYKVDEFIKVTDEVAQELRAGKVGDVTHWRRLKRNKANYLLDAGDGIENEICVHEPSPEVLIMEEERLTYLCRALNSLNEVQGRRVDASIILEKKTVTIAAEDGVSAKAVSESVRRGLLNMKQHLQRFYF